jgi:hypothetical protein
MKAVGSFGQSGNKNTATQHHNPEVLSPKILNLFQEFFRSERKLQHFLTPRRTVVKNSTVVKQAKNSSILAARFFSLPGSQGLHMFL